MSNLRKYKTMEMDFNRLDVEEIIKDDEELKDAVAKLQNTLKSTTTYLNGTCRRLAFAMLLDIIPRNYIHHVMSRSGPIYTGVCATYIRRMSCDGMTDEEVKDLKYARDGTKPYITTIKEFW